ALAQEPGERVGGAGPLRMPQPVEGLEGRGPPGERTLGIRLPRLGEEGEDRRRVVRREAGVGEEEEPPGPERPQRLERGLEELRRAGAFTGPKQRGGGDHATTCAGLVDLRQGGEGEAAGERGRRIAR